MIIKMNFSQENVFLNVSESSINSLLEYISEVAVITGYTTDAKALNKSFIDREKEFSTGLEDGFAIPHAKTAVVKKAGFLYFRLANPLKWQTYDDQPVTDVFALMVPPQNVGNEHLKMLANLSTALLEHDFKKELRRMTNRNEIANFINERIGE